MAHAGHAAPREVAGREPAALCSHCHGWCPFHFLEEMHPTWGRQHPESGVRLTRAPGGLSLGGRSRLTPLQLRTGLAVQAGLTTPSWAAVISDAPAGTTFILAVGSVLCLRAPGVDFTFC